MLGRLFLFIVILNITRLSLSKTDLLASREYCGLQHTDDYTRDNDNISLDEFPWIAQLLYGKDKYVNCAGALINRRYVITAAHCPFPVEHYRGVIIRREENITGIRLGDFNVDTETDCQKNTKFGEECSDPVQEFGIEEVIQHPKYNLGLGTNNIALIRLSSNVDYSEYIRPICLPTSKDMDLVEGVELALSGWGYDRIVNRTPIKKKILAKFTPPDECQRIHNYFQLPVATSDQLCAVEGNETYTCVGDGGGPLMLSVKNQWVQVGIVSFDGNCGRVYPTVFVKISSYLDWIKETIRA